MSETADRSPWRLLVDPAADGARNMAVDETLLEGVGAGTSPATLRFFRWRPACLSIGYFQPYAVVDQDACLARGVDVVRRPTGGRAIYHHDELTYSVTLPLAVLGRDRGVLASYRRLSQGLQLGLQRLGVAVTLAPGHDQSRRPTHGPACFDQPSGHELLLDGRKLVGSAQVRRNGALLQHGSILFAPQLEPFLQCLRLQPEEERGWRAAMEAGVIGLRSFGLAQPATITFAITDAFASLFAVNLVAGSLSPAERRHAAVLRERKYANAAWTGRF